MAQEEVGTFLKPLEGFLARKDYGSARSILELVVEKYGLALQFLDLTAVADGVLQVTADSLKAQPGKKVLDLPNKLAAVIFSQLEGSNKPLLLLGLDFWSRLGEAYTQAAQRTGFHWLFLAACRLGVRARGLCDGNEEDSKIESIRLLVESHLDYLETAMLWYGCLPRTAVALEKCCETLKTLSAQETLEVVSNLFGTEPLLALRGLADKFSPPQFVLCKSLIECMKPVLAELHSSLRTLAQKLSADSAGILGLVDRVTNIANHLAVFREFQDAVVECYQIISRHTNEQKVLQLLAASWQTKLDMEGQVQNVERASLTYSWRRDDKALSILWASCATMLTPSPSLEFHTRYTDGILHVVQQMLRDVLASFGPAPCPFAVIATGSLSRREMSMGSDLDLSILVRSRDIPVPFFTRLVEQLELRLQWQTLSLDELTVSYVAKANEFGLNNIPPLVCALHAEFSKGTANVEPFALLWPKVVFATEDGGKLCQEFIEGTQAYFSDNMACFQTGFNWIKSHMTNLRQHERGALTTGQGLCNIKKELLQPLTVWCLDLAVFFGVLGEASTLACVRALASLKQLHPRFLAQFEDALVYLQYLRARKYVEGADSDEFAPPTAASSETEDKKLQSGVALKFLTQEEWQKLQTIHRYLVRPILYATEFLCALTQERLANSKAERTRPQEIFAEMFPTPFDPLMTSIGLLARKVFPYSSESWESGLVERTELPRAEREKIEAELKDIISYVASQSALAFRSEDATFEAQKAAFMELVPIPSIRALYCQLLQQHLELAKVPGTTINALMQVLGRCPTSNGTRKTILDDENDWQRLLETGLTCKGEAEPSGLEVMLEWAHVTEDQQSPPLRRVLRNCFQDSLINEDGSFRSATNLELKLPLEDLEELKSNCLARRADASFLLQLNHVDPCFHLSVQALGSKITGYRSGEALAKVTVLKVGLPLDQVHAALITLPLPSGTIRGEQCDPDRLVLDKRSFSLKVFETLILRPEDESPSNLVFEPISAQQSAVYRPRRVSNMNCFVRHSVIERREGPRKTEKLGCRSFLFCMTAMQDQLSQEAIMETLLLDPKRVLDAWLNEMIYHNTVYVATERNADAFRKDPTFKWSSEPIFSLAEIRRLDELRPSEHRSHPLVSHAIAPHVIQSLFQRLVCLKEILKRPEASKYTHLNLLEEMDPLLHQYYSSNCWNTKSANSQQRWQSIPEGFHEARAGYMVYAVREPLQFVAPTNEVSALRDVNPRAGKSHLKQVYCFLRDAQMARGRLAKGHLRQSEQPLMDAAFELMINSTDFTRVSASDGWDNAQVLQEMFSTIRFCTLQLGHCERLTGPLLSSILQYSSSTLTSLDISCCPSWCSETSITNVLEALASCKQLEVLDMSSLDALTFVANKCKKNVYKPLTFNRLQQLNLSQCIHLSHIKLIAPCLENLMARDCLALQVVEVSSRVPLTIDVRGCHRLGDNTVQDLFDPPFKLESFLPLEAAEAARGALASFSSSRSLPETRAEHEAKVKLKRNQLVWVDFSGANGLHNLSMTPEVTIDTLLLNNCPQLASLTIQNAHLKALALQDCRLLARLTLLCHNLRELELGGSYFSLFPSIIIDVLLGCVSLQTLRTRSPLSEIFKRVENTDAVMARTTPHVAVLTEPQDGVRHVCEEIFQGSRDTAAAVLGNIGSIAAICSCFLKCDHEGKDASICCNPRKILHLILKSPPGLDLLSQSGTMALTKMAQTVWLHSLHLEGFNLGDQGSTLICEAFQSNPRRCLTALRLVNTGIGDQGCVSVARLLQLGFLTDLSLKQNTFGDTGCKALAAALQATSRLRGLDITENRNIGVDGLYAVAVAADRHLDLKLRIGLWTPHFQKIAKNWGRKLKLKTLSLRVLKEENQRDADLDLDVRLCSLCLSLTEIRDTCKHCGFTADEGPSDIKTSESSPRRFRVSVEERQRQQSWFCSCGNVNPELSAVCECGQPPDNKQLSQCFRCLDNVALVPAQSFVDGVGQALKQSGA